jgi:histone acetyltransferase (RNA polymerase elongator complex component)
VLTGLLDSDYFRSTDIVKKFTPQYRKGPSRFTPISARMLREVIAIAVMVNSCYCFHVCRFASLATTRFTPFQSMSSQSDQLFSKSQNRARSLARLSMTTTSEQAMEDCKHMSVRDIKVELLDYALEILKPTKFCAG